MRTLLFAVAVLVSPLAGAEEKAAVPDATDEAESEPIVITTDKVPPQRYVLTRSKHATKDLDRAGDHLEDATKRTK